MIGRATLYRFGVLISGEEEKPIRDCSLLVKDGLVEAVGTGDEVKVPSGTEEVDASGWTAMPGLIDCHVHLFSDSSGSKLNPELWELKTSYVGKLMHAVANSRKTLEGGFTTVRNMAHQWEGYPEWDVSLRNAIDQGMVPGPRILASVDMIGTTGSHGDVFLPPFYPMRPIKIADGADACRKAVRENVRLGADFIKVTSSGGGVLGWGDRPEWRNFTEEELRAVVDEAHAFGKTVAAHAVGLQGIRNAVKCGVDTIEHGYFLDEETILDMKKRGVKLVPTLTAVNSMLTIGKEKGIPEEHIQSIARLQEGYVKSLKFAVKAGLKMAIGTDIAGTWALHGQNARELSLRVRLLGLSPFEAIRSATGVAAEVLGLNDRGTLTPGRRADLILVNGNPLDDITILEDSARISTVIKGGDVAVNRGGPSLPSAAKP